MMDLTIGWRRESGARIEGSRPLDNGKLQAPCIVVDPCGGYRLFYTAVGPGKPFRTCQGYVCSAVSDDGLSFRPEPGIRVAPQPDLPHMRLRVLAPSVARRPDGRWRMYFEARGPADRPRVICSAVSDDMLRWEIEDGIRLSAFGGVGAPRCLPLPDGRGRLYCVASVYAAGGPGCGTRFASGVVSAVTSNGLDFELEPGFRMTDRQAAYDTAGITAAEVIPPADRGDRWTMFLSAWRNVPPGTAVPPHPSADPDAEKNGLSEDFAAASIAADMAGYRSSIRAATSADGLAWDRAGCVIEGSGHGGGGLDAVHAEDMSLIGIGGGAYRMYYAACDALGRWRIASAVRDAP